MPATHQRHTSPHEYKPTCLECRSRVPVSFQVDFSKDPCFHEAVHQELRQAVAGHHVHSNAAILRNSHSPPTPHHLQKRMGPHLHSAPWGMEGTPGLLLEVGSSEPPLHCHPNQKRCCPLYRGYSSVGRACLLPWHTRVEAPRARLETRHPKVRGTELSPGAAKGGSPPSPFL